MDTLVGLPETFEREKCRYEQVAREKFGLYLYKATNRHNGRVHSEVGHVTVEPATVHALTGVLPPAYETFVADKRYDNPTDASQGLIKAVIDAAKADAGKPRRTRKKRVPVVIAE